VITKILVSAAIALGATVGVAAPASADPSPFSNLGCSCQAPGQQGTGPAVTEQMNQGIQAALTDLPGIRGQQ
jgi:hypothetical protein